MRLHAWWESRVGGGPGLVVVQQEVISHLAGHRCVTTVHRPHSDGVDGRHLDTDDAVSMCPGLKRLSRCTKQAGLASQHARWAHRGPLYVLNWPCDASAALALVLQVVWLRSEVVVTHIVVN